MWTPKFGQNSIRSFGDEFGIVPGMPDRKRSPFFPGAPFHGPRPATHVGSFPYPGPCRKNTGDAPTPCAQGLPRRNCAFRTPRPMPLRAGTRSVFDKKTGAAVRRTRLLCIHAPTRTLFLRKRIDLDIVIGRLVPVSRIDLRVGHAECGRSAVSVKRNIDRFGFL